MRMTKYAIDIVGLGVLITALVIPGLALAGSSDIGLFAGGGAVPPNITLLIDIILETRDRQHFNRILTELQDADYTVSVLDPNAPE